MKIDELLKEQVLLRMKYDNPWWTTDTIPADYMALPRRLYLDTFYMMVTQRDIKRGVILMGPRRVGKTVMLYHTIDRLIKEGTSSQKIIYLSIDTPIYNNISLEMLFAMAREAMSQPDMDGKYVVVYDEIQYLNNWEQHLKSLIDSYRNVKFVASGSASAALKMKSQESGAGRFSDFMLPPLTFNEYIHLLGYENLIVPKTFVWGNTIVDGFDTVDIQVLNQHFLNYINYGGYPEIVFSESMRRNPGQFIRHDIVDKVLLRDLPSLYGIHDTQELYRFFVHIVFRSGSEFSYDDLSKESGIRKDTVKKYIEYLEAAFLIKVINRIDVNARRMQRVTTFKIYITNPALRCALFSPLTFNDNMMGNMVETAIFAQWIQRNSTDVYYANWKEGRSKGEVDMVGLDIARQKPGWCVEIKWSDRYITETADLKSLLSFLDANRMDSAIVTSISTYEIKQLEHATLHFIPSALYAYTCGHNTIKRKRQELGLG